LKLYFQFQWTFANHGYFIPSEKERDTILRGNSKPKGYTAKFLVSYPAFQSIANQSIGTPFAKCFTPNKNTEIP
jgi:hypothetical protein